jgi:rSAM/selenodomain-associated transferase 2
MISVIIPALNEEENISRCIGSIREESSSCEIIVSDGGSTDRTKEAAAGFQGVTVVDSKKGRGRQMNAGASQAKGEVLLFLHADTTLEQGWAKGIMTAMKDASVVGGAFTFCVDNPLPKFRSVEAWVRMRCAVFSLPYGDQGIFIRKTAFEKLGGYSDIPLMEDVDILGKMKKHGTITILDKRAVTSGRRWAEKGIIRTAAINQATMMLYRLGVSPERLARFYYR